MRHFTIGFWGTCTALLMGCGGSVLFGEDDGTGGGGANEGGFAQGLAPSGGAPGPSPSSGGAPPIPPANGGAGGGGFQVPQTECGIACDVLFQCGLEPSSAGASLCPGFEPGDQQDFSNFCVQECEDQPAALSLIDGEDCEGTVATISSVSTGFASLCDVGF